ncbi:MAG: riboflavin synthase [Gammaproteobacteria bacterium]|nr:riboflavin synthase [Gammaproteobacteria bacterium]
MFTGIIQDVGRIAGRDDRGGDIRLKIATQHLDLQHLAVGSSIAVNGVCLTALAVGAGEFSADVSRETLQVTSLQTARVGTKLNLERALRLTDGLDGHLVSGHVDATAAVRSLRDDGRSWRFRIALPSALRRFVAAKGSITVDGVSLTVNDVTAADFGVNIIPHTFENTIFRHYRNGTHVNLEVDLVARYTATLLAHGAG